MGVYGCTSSALLERVEARIGAYFHKLSMAPCCAKRNSTVRALSAASALCAVCGCVYVDFVCGNDYDSTVNCTYHVYASRNSECVPVKVVIKADYGHVVLHVDLGTPSTHARLVDAQDALAEWLSMQSVAVQRLFKTHPAFAPAYHSHMKEQR